MCIVWFSFIHPTKCNTVRFVAKNINKGFKKKTENAENDQKRSKPIMPFS